MKLVLALAMFVSTAAFAKEICNVSVQDGNLTGALAPAGNPSGDGTAVVAVCSDATKVAPASFFLSQTSLQIKADALMNAQNEAKAMNDVAKQLIDAGFMPVSATVYVK
jgi:hypothetical protein